VLCVIEFLSVLYLFFSLWWDLINSLLVKCPCVDVTDPSLFMFPKLSIDSGQGVASLSSLSHTNCGSYVFFLLPLKGYLSVISLLNCNRSNFEVQPEFASGSNFLAGEH